MKKLEMIAITLPTDMKDYTLFPDQTQLVSSDVLRKEVL